MKIKDKIGRISRVNRDSKNIIGDIEALNASINHKNGYHQCLIFDQRSGTHYSKMLSTEIIPDCVPLNDSGELVYYLLFDGSLLEPLDYLPNDNANKTPLDCYQAQWWEGLKKILSIKTSLGERIKLGIFVALAFGLMVLIFLLGAQSIG